MLHSWGHRVGHGCVTELTNVLKCFEIDPQNGFINHLPTNTWYLFLHFSSGLVVKNLHAVKATKEMWVQSLGLNCPWRRE